MRVTEKLKALKQIKRKRKKASRHENKHRANRL